MKTAIQTSTLAVSVPIMPMDGLTRDRMERLVKACLDSIEEQAQDQEYSLVWPTLTIVATEDEVLDFGVLQGSTVSIHRKRVVVTVDGVREVEVEDE